MADGEVCLAGLPMGTSTTFCQGILNTRGLHNHGVSQVRLFNKKKSIDKTFASKLHTSTQATRQPIIAGDALSPWDKTPRTGDPGLPSVVVSALQGSPGSSPKCGRAPRGIWSTSL